MADKTKRELISEISEEEIEQYYRNGSITTHDRNALMREKAHATVESLLEDKGYVSAILERTIKHAQEGWDGLVEAALRETPLEHGLAPPPIDVASKAFSYFWGQLQIVMSPLTAFGEVTGKKVELLALSAGASPGLARVLNIAADVGTGFFPLGKAIQTGAKAVQAGVETAKAVTGAATKVASEEARAVAIVKEGLKAEGIPEEKLVGMTAAAKPKGGLTPEQLAARTASTPGGGPTAQATAKEFKLSQALSGAKPRYAIGYKQYVPQFESDLDKALFILAQSKPSEHDARYMKAVRDYMAAQGYDLSPIEIRNLGRQVRDAVKTVAAKAEPGVIDIPKTAMGLPVPGVRPSVADSIASEAERAAIGLTDAQARADIRATAKKYDLNVNELFKDRHYTTVQMHTFLQAMLPHIDDLSNLAKKAIVEGATDADRVKFARTVSEIFGANPGGEEVQYSKSMMDMLSSWDAESMAKGDIQGAMTTLAQDFAAINKEGLLKTILKNQSGFMTMGDKWWPQVREVYINLLLPFAWIPTFLSNSVTTGMSVAERATAAMFSTSAHGVSIKEPYYMMKGMALAMGDGIRAYGDAYRYVYVVTPQGPRITHLTGSSGRLDFLPAIQSPVLGRIMRVPGDTVRGMDNLFNTLLTRGSYYSHAIREAEQNPQAVQAAGGLGQFIRQRVVNPTNEMMVEAKEFAETGTFQNQLGIIGQHIRSVAQAGPLVLWFPFMKSPINLAKYAWARTPGLQLLSKQLYKDIAEGGPKADMAVARLTLSNMLGIFYHEMAKEDMITGSGPVDPTLRRVWLLTHQPYSAKSKDGWIPYAPGMEPQSTPMGLIADFTQISDTLSPDDREQAGFALTFSIMHDFADKTWWQNADALIDVLQGLQQAPSVARAERIQAERGGMPSTAAEEKPSLSESTRKFLTAPLTAVGIPFMFGGGPLGQRFTRVVDPVLRETRSLVDDFMSRTPGFSQKLPPVRDAFGDPVTPPQAIAGGPWLGLLRPVVPSFRPFETDRAKIEADKLQVAAPYFPWSYQGVQLTSQERDRWQQIYRRILRHPELGIEKRVLDNSEIQKQPHALRRELFSTFMYSARSFAWSAMLTTNSDLAHKVMQAQVEETMPKIQEGQRPGFQAQTSEATDLFSNMPASARENLLRWGILGGDE